MTKHIIIAGGNGFLGKAIAQLAGKSGIHVTSLSRSGKPAGINDVDYPNVHWLAADVLKPGPWTAVLEHSQTVINCIGTIKEQPKKKITYRRMIFESAQVLADEAERMGIARFIQISAIKGMPQTPTSYLAYKRAAEAYLSVLYPAVSIIRPGILYGEERPESVTQANLLMEKMATDSNLKAQLWDVRPTHVYVVANAVLQLVTDQELHGIFATDEIEQLNENHPFT